MPVRKKKLRKCSDRKSEVIESLTLREMVLSGSVEGNWRKFKQGFVVHQQTLGAKEKEEPGLL